MKDTVMPSIAMQNSALEGLTVADQKLFEEYGFGKKVMPKHSLLHAAFAEMAQLYPETPAVEHMGKTVTYSELDHRSNALAQQLVELGVQPGDHVGVFLQRSIEMVVGILATLKVGAAYVPQHLGISSNQQLEHVIKTAGIKIVLTTREFSLQQPKDSQANWICIDRPRPMSNGFLSPEIPSTHSCFVLFTSGTTGMPNGVQVSHKNVANILMTEPGNLGVKPRQRVSQILNIAFDMAAWEIFTALCHGATLVIRGKDFQEATENVDVIIATPSVLKRIDPSMCRSVKTVAVAGEPCPVNLADEWSKVCRFFNSCGPTETTIVNTMHLHEINSDLSIGAPTPNNSVYVLDENLNPLPIGEVGEMWAGGDCVTKGYLNNDLLNFERYKPDPFLGEGHFMFRTRDLGRWNSQGELEHMGRTDDQVKIRGFRVELDSVSAVLEKTPHCSHALTLKWDSRNLICFAVTTNDMEEVLKEAIANELPYYCIPLHVFCLDELPMTDRGKVDKRTLLRFAQQKLTGVMR